MKKKLLILPVILYSIFLIICPLIYILILSFLKSDSYGGVIFTLTLENYKELFDFVYIKIFLKSFVIALVTTLFSILISYPFCIFLSSKKKIVKDIIMTLVIIPFLTNSLIRTYGVYETLTHIYIVMERGKDNLKHYIAKNSLSIDTKYELVEQLVKGLYALHSLGIIHRDIKLENVLLD